MKYIFFGTPRFAEIVLKKLIDSGMLPVALVCNPDKPVGRKKVITPPPTKKLLTTNYSLPTVILQPEKLDDEFLTRLKKLKADFYVVAAYAKILPKKLLQIPHLGVIGVHPSLLPKYRGATPIQSAILSGGEKTGISLYLIDEGMDSGSILAQRELEIVDVDYRKLEEELAELAGAMLVETLPKFVKGEIKPMPQDDSRATYTRKFKTEDGFIDSEALRKAEAGDKKLAKEIYNKIRALNPEPGVYTIKNGKRIKLLKAKLAESGELILLEIQKEGGKPQTI